MACQFGKSHDRHCKLTFPGELLPILHLPCRRLLVVRGPPSRASRSSHFSSLFTWMHRHCTTSAPCKGMFSRVASCNGLEYRSGLLPVFPAFCAPADRNPQAFEGNFAWPGRRSLCNRGIPNINTTSCGYTLTGPTKRVTFTSASHKSSRPCNRLFIGLERTGESTRAVCHRFSTGVTRCFLLQPQVQGGFQSLRDHSTGIQPAAAAPMVPRWHPIKYRSGAIHG